jgi:hypothetical protein
MPLGVPVTTSPTVERLQDVTPSAVGFVAVWTDTRSATAGNPTDLYAQWTDGYAGPAPGWPASGLALCTAPGRQDAAVVSAARTGTYAAFAWEDHRGADADIYAELRLANGSLPTGLWQTDGLPATSAPGDQTAPVVGDGNGGGCFVAWQDARDQATLGLDIYAQAFTSEGEKLDVPPFGVPPRALLGAPQPNPTRSSSAFVVDVPFPPQTVRVDVVDLAGRRVRTIAHGTYPVGRQSFTFDGLDDNGRPVPPGVYRVHARVGDATMSQTLVRVN